MEIKNLQSIPAHERGQYLENLENKAKNKSEFSLRIQEGKTSREDLATLLTAARASKSYQKNHENYQFRLKTGSDGSQLLSLKEQGLWSRFKGIFGWGSERRAQERSDAVRYIDSLISKNGDRVEGADYKKFDAIGDHSVLSHTQNTLSGAKLTYQSAKAFQEGLLQRYTTALENAEKSERDAVVNEFKQVVHKLYGFIAADSFVALLKKDSPEGSLYNTDKKSVRAALREIEEQFGAQAAAPKHPEVLSEVRSKNEEVLAELKSNWDPVSVYPEGGGLFPQQCLVDINRQAARLENGTLVSKYGSAAGAGPGYLDQEKEKYIQFFESAVGVSRSAPEFQNMFRNLIRNFNQNAEIAHTNNLMLIGIKAGYSPDKFMLNSNHPRVGMTISSDGENISVKRRMEIDIFLRDENIPLQGVATEEFKIPVKALNIPEKNFDISKVALEPTRTYSIAPAAS